MRAGKINFAEVFVYAGIIAVLLGWRVQQFLRKMRLQPTYGVGGKLS